MKSKNYLTLLLIASLLSFQGFSQDTEVVQVNFALWSSVYTDWNKTDNVVPNTGAIVLQGPVQTLNGSNLPISIAIESQFDGPNYGGMTSGIYPADVMKRGYYVESSEGKIKLSGLDLSKKYTITCFGSKNAYNNEDFTTIYTEVTSGTDGQSISLNAYKNTNNTVNLIDLVPNSSGEILLSVKKGANALYGYINAIVVTIADNISIQKPDLAFISSSINPDWARPGGEISIETYIQNIGEYAAESSDLRFYLSEDSELDAFDLLLGSTIVKDEETGLDAGELFSSLKNITVPRSAMVGAMYLLQVVDQDNLIEESSEENNLHVQLISVLDPPMTRYVSPAGSDVNGDGTKTNPYVTPQHAVDIANPYDTVHLLVGEYQIDDTIKLKSNITFRGDAADETKLNHDFHGNEDFVYLYMEDVENVNISDLYLRLIGPIIDDELFAGIQVDGAKNVNITRCVIFNGVKGIIFNDVEDYSVVNCSIHGDLGGYGLGEIFENNCNGTKIIKNNIFYYEPLTSVNSGGDLQFTYNSGCSGYSGSNGNICANPDYLALLYGDLHLQPTSPCINAGDPLSPLDKDGTRADMGALPFVAETIYVSTSGSDLSGDGSISNPFGTVEFGLRKANAYDTLHLLAGHHIIQDELVLKSGLYIRGDGADVTTIFRDYEYEEDVDFAILKMIDVVNVTARDLKLTSYLSDHEKIHTAISVNNGQNIKINRCIMYNVFNGITAEFSDIEILNNTMVGQLSQENGSAIFIEDCNNLIIKNNILHDFNYGINLLGSTGNEILYNDVYGNFDGVSVRNYVGVPDQTGINGNISLDPEYLNYYIGDGILSSSSPCIDAGDPSSPLDPDLTRADMGAIPYYHPLRITAEVQMPSCYNSSDGAVDLTITGGMPPYAIMWNTGEVAEDIDNLEAGIYEVSIAEVDGQSTLREFNLYSPPELEVTALLSQPECELIPTGEIGFSIAGGSAPYYYQIDDGPIQNLGNDRMVVSELVFGGESEGYDIDRISALETDIFGNIYVNGRSVFGFDIDGVNVPAGQFLLKFNSWLEPLWGVNAGIGQVDANGNYYYVNGYISAGVNFYKLYKLDADGNLLFQKTLDGPYSLDLDFNNNIILFGSSKLMKLDSFGNDIWEKSVSGVVYYDHYQVVSGESITISGNSNDALQIGDDEIAANGFYIAQFSQDGDLIWQFTPSHASTEEATLMDIKLDQNGNLLAVGGVYGAGNLPDDQGTVVFDEDHVLITALDDIGFLVKIGFNGEVIWLQEVETNLQSIVNSLSMNKFGDIAISQGFFIDRTIESYNENGELQFQLGSTEEFNYENSPLHSLYDNSGNLFIGGNFFSQINIADHEITTDDLGSRLFIVKYGYQNEMRDLGLLPGPYNVKVSDHFGCSQELILNIDESTQQLPPDICVITVDDLTGNLKVIWQPKDGLDGYNVYRESTETEGFELVASAISGINEYIDQEANAQVRSYRYKLSASDLCGVPTDLGFAHKSMHLTVNTGLNAEVNLIWDAYEGFEYSSFNIFRGPTPNNISELLATVPANIFSYTDLAQDVNSTYYQIEVVSNNLCGTPSSGRITDEKPKSHSNVASRKNEVTALNNSIQDNIKIYPNPPNDLLNIKVPENPGEVNEITIRNLTGIIVKKATLHAQGEESIDIGDLDSGIYILTLNLGNTQTYNSKFFVRR